jgi:hypothetical protein
MTALTLAHRTFQVAGNAVTTTTITTPCAAGATGADGAPAGAPHNAHQVVAPAPTVKAAPAAPVIAPAQGRVAGTIPIGGTGGARVIHAKRDVTKPDYLATCNDEQVTNACKSLLTNNAAGKNVLVAETVTMTTSVGPVSRCVLLLLLLLLPLDRGESSLMPVGTRQAPQPTPPWARARSSPWSTPASW